MTRTLVTLTAAALAAGSIIGLPGAAHADVGDAMMSQAELDAATLDPNRSGGWADAIGGVAARPYVKRFSVTNGAVTTDVITDGVPGAVPTSLGGSDLTAVVAPINVCRAGQDSNCYPSPNRVQVTVAYDVGGQLHYDLSRRDPGAGPVVTSDTVIDLEIGLNTTGSTLGWTWATGSPGFWDTEALGTSDGSVRVRFTPGVQPVMNGGAGCSAIPVQSCDIDRADADFLVGTLLLSLDDTLGPAFAGALFATDGAMIGSLESSPGPQPQLAYGAASTHLTATGELREGRIQAFLSEEMLADTFGVAGDPSSLLQVQRTNGAGSTGQISWEQWRGADQGSDGWLVTIPGITFSAPKYVVTRVQPPGGGGDTPGTPRRSVKVKAAAKKSSVLTVDVDPDLRSADWALTVQERVTVKGSAGRGKKAKDRARGKKRTKWVAVASGTTTGPRETWSRNLPKGQYRVAVTAQNGYRAAVSNVVNIKR